MEEKIGLGQGGGHRGGTSKSQIHENGPNVQGAEKRKFGWANNNPLTLKVTGASAKVFITKKKKKTGRKKN